MSRGALKMNKVLVLNALGKSKTIELHEINGQYIFKSISDMCDLVKWLPEEGTATIALENYTELTENVIRKIGQFIAERKVIRGIQLYKKITGFSTKVAYDIVNEYLPKGWSEKRDETLKLYADNFVREELKKNRGVK